MRVLVLATTAMVLLWSAASSAEETSPHPTTRDPLFPAAVGAGAAGLVFGVAGAGVWASATTQQRCSSFGCVDGRGTNEEHESGATLVGSGSGLAVVGVVGLAVSLGAPLEPGEKRQAPVAASLGLVLTSISASALGGGLAYGRDGGRWSYERSIPHFVASGVFAGVGVPLLAFGAQIEKEMGPATQTANPVLVGLGSTLMTAGTAGGLICAVAAANYESNEWLDFTGVFLTGGAVLSFGAAIGGIPLVVIGAREVPVSAPRSQAPVPRLPELSLGAGSVSLVGEF